MCVAIPCRVESVTATDGPSRPARVTLSDGSTREIDLALVPDAGVGDYVVAHSGLAVSRLAPEEATAAFGLLSAMPGHPSPTDDQQT
ncbi:MAG: HypC/HybG/HupF family hydrogenase formation chaperone [Acidimicrobiia bacterium]